MFGLHADRSFRLLTFGVQFSFLLQHVGQFSPGACERGAGLGKLVDATAAGLTNRLQLLDPLVPHRHALVQAALVLLVRGEERLERIQSCLESLDLRRGVSELLLHLTPRRRIQAIKRLPSVNPFELLDQQLHSARDRGAVLAACCGQVLKAPRDAERPLHSAAFNLHEANPKIQSHGGRDRDTIRIGRGVLLTVIVPVALCVFVRLRVCAAVASDQCPRQD